MKESSQKNLKKAIQQLPSHTPRPGTWDTIARSLDFEDELRRTLPELPEQEPKATSWERIEAALPSARYRRLLPLGRYAAAALLVLSVGIYFFRINTTTETEVVLTYHEEPAPSFGTYPIDPADPREKEALDYIQQLCQQAPPTTCQQPRFLALKTHLAELSQEEQKLKAAMQRLGYDPQLVKYQVRIENLRADATKELIQLLMG